MKRSREKTRQQAKEARDRLKNVQDAADQLQMRVELRRIELQNFKDLFSETLQKLKNSGREIDMTSILADDDPGSRQWQIRKIQMTSHTWLTYDEPAMIFCILFWTQKKT